MQYEHAGRKWTTLQPLYRGSKYYFSACFAKIILKLNIYTTRNTIVAICNKILKSGNGKVVKIFIPEKTISNLSESHYFVKFGMKRDKEKCSEKIKFVKYIIFLHFKFFSLLFTSE